MDNDIKRRNTDVKGRLFVGDVFDCDDAMATYLTGGNAKNKVVVKVLEIKPMGKKNIEPETKNAVEVKIDIKPKKKKTTKSKASVK